MLAAFDQCFVRISRRKVAKMEAIKKKMQALKIEKDNAMDRAEAAENQLRDSNIRVEKVAFCQQGSFHEQSVTID